MTDYTRSCAVEGCERAHKAKGYCRMHWDRLKRRGTTDKFDPQYPTVEESLRTRVKRVGDCIEWTGALTPSGYGSLRVNRVAYYTHRLSWEQANGPIPKGLVIDHICRNPSCLNVDHLRAITQAQNMQNLGETNSVNTSGARGVFWVESAKRWNVKVGHNGKSHWGGSYADKNEAIQAARDLRAKVLPYSQN